MIRTGRSLVLLGALALFAACGGDGGGDDAGGDSGDEGLTAEEQELADAFAGTLADDENGFSVEPQEADCMAEALMAELGVEPFEEAGVTPDDIEPGGDSSPGELLGDGTVTREQADAIIAVWEADCVDIVDLLVESAGSELELDPDGQECFAAGLGEGDLAVGLLAGSFTSGDGTPDEDTVEAFLALLDECGDGTDNPVVGAIAEELAADGSLTVEQSECLAQGVVDVIGPDRMGELFSVGGFDDLDAEAQDEVTGALLQAAESCDVPLSAFG